MDEVMGRAARAAHGLVAAVLGLAVSVASAAVVYVEAAGDAGDLAVSAQDAAGSGPLAAIRGHLDGDIDVYRLVIDAPAAFSASTASSGIAFNNFDMALFLFDAQGRGVYANDDDPSWGPWSVLPAGHASGPLVPGVYLLAIAGAGSLPQSIAGAIFPVLGGLLDGTSDVLGASGPGGALPLAGWTGPSSETGDYEIVLSGAAFVKVPEPATAWLAALALAGVAAARRRRVRRPLLAGLLALAAAASHAQYAKLDAALSDFVDGVAGTVPGADYASAARFDGGGRLLVDVYLDGTLPMDSVVAGLASLGALVVFGHKGAAGAIAVAAYAYTSPFSQQSPFAPAFEPFSSPGPVTIAFDAADRRLASPETRKKPDLAAPDGVDTSFFGDGDDDASGFPNFFGTSAAAPHAAGAAALLLQRAGGPGRLTPQQVRSMLQTTTPARPLPYGGSALVRTWSPHDGFGLIDVLGALSRLP